MSKDGVKVNTYTLCIHIQGLYHIMTGYVEKVLEVLVASAEQGPDGAGALEDVAGLSLPAVVAQERAIETRVRVLDQFHLARHKETFIIIIIS